MIYVTSDWHGYPLRDIQKLLHSARFGDSDYLYVLGDVIDRNGDGGIHTLRWLMQQPNIQMLLGNHEDMLLSCRFLFEEIAADTGQIEDERKLNMLSCWLANGAQPTIHSLQRLGRKDWDKVMNILAFLEKLPLYENVHAQGKDYLLVHGGLGGFDPEKSMEKYEPDELLWHRPVREEMYFPDIITVLGHTPTVCYDSPDRMFRTPTWLDIDTGGAMGHPPMLLRLEDQKEFYL